MEILLEILKMFGLVLMQNAAFTLVSRARNSKSITYHTLAAIGSNGIWLLVIREVVLNFDKTYLMVTYLAASVLGSIFMHWFAMKFLEKPRVKKQYEDLDAGDVAWIKKASKAISFDNHKVGLTVTVSEPHVTVDGFKAYQK